MIFAGCGGEFGLVSLVGTVLGGLGWAATVHGRHFRGGLCSPRCAKYCWQAPVDFETACATIYDFARVMRLGGPVAFRLAWSLCADGCPSENGARCSRPLSFYSLLVPML